MRSKKTVINIISSLALQIVNIICSFIIPRLIIKSFGSNINGLVTSITQFLAYITLMESGFGPVVKAVLYKPIANKDKNTIEGILKASEKFFRIISYVFIGYIVVLCVLLPNILSQEFNRLFVVSLVVIISMSTFAEYFFGMTYKLYLQAEQKNYIISLIQIISTIINAIIIVILIYFGTNIHIVKLATAIIFIFRPIVQNIYIKKKYNIDLKRVNNSYKIKQKWDGLAQHIASVIHSNADVTILTIFTNTVEVSIYSVYYLVVAGVRAIIQSFTSGIDAYFGDMIAKGEKKSLDTSFKIYEIFYFTIVTIVFTIILLMILPFVSIYTSGITDANYYRPAFAYMLVLSEFMWSIRLPYSTLALSAGHFRETMKGAWIESIVNVVLSCVLVFEFGIVGVAIGTLVAMLIRTCEFVYHTSKYILERSIWESVKKITVIVVEMLIIVLIMNILPQITIMSYSTWILQAIITAIVAILVTLGINTIMFKQDIKVIVKTIKRIISRKRVKQ